MTEHGRYEVVVGSDGSESSLRAVRWAAREAAGRDGSLRIIHARTWPTMLGAVGMAPGLLDDGIVAEARRTLQVAAVAATTAEPAVLVSTEIITGAPQLVLTVASHEADLLVLGDRGLGGFTELLLGSLAASLTHRASCTVVIVRGVERPGGPVVVGVDGSGADGPVLAAAFALADRHGAGILAVHAWDSPSFLHPSPAWSREAGRLEHRASALLEHAVAEVRTAYPTVDVTLRTVGSSPTAALVEASRGALVVVVGSHGAGAVHGLLAGSVCHGVIRHAECPVEIIRVEDVLSGRAEAS